MPVNPNAVLGGREKAAVEQMRRLRPCVIATRGHFPVRNNAVVSGDRLESQIFMRTGVAAATNVQLIYANMTTSTGAELFDAGSVSITPLEASLLAGGYINNASFFGVVALIMGLGASLVVSDRIGVYLAPNTEFSVKTGTIANATGQHTASCRSTTKVTKVKSTASVSQIFTAANVSTPAGGSTIAYALTPCAVIGIPDRPIVSLAIFGTSIPIGQGDTADAADGHLGYAERACSSVNGFSLPFINLSRDGAQSTTFAQSNSRFALLQFVSHVLFDMGTNDIAAGVALAVLQANCLRAWARAKLAGCKVYHATILPRTTGNPATPAGQTPVAGFEVGGVADQFNAWLYTQVTAGNLDGVLNTRAAVADPVLTDRWAVGMTTDMTHPNPTGTLAMTVPTNALLASFAA